MLSCVQLLRLHRLSAPGSSVHGILPARILECVAISASGDLPNPGIELHLLHWQTDSLLMSYQGSQVCARGYKFKVNAGAAAFSLLQVLV